MKIRVVQKILNPALVLITGWLISGCTYEPLESPEMPTYYQTINIPLADITLPLSDMVDSTNHIYGDSSADEIYFKFNGNLDTIALTEDIFQIPAAASLNFSQNFDQLNQAVPPISQSITNTFKLSEQLGLPLPLAYDWPVIGGVPRTKLMDSKYEYQIFDKNSIPYFDRLDYVTIGSGTFMTEITNEMLVALDSVRISLRNRDGSLLAETFFETIPSGTTARDGESGNLDGAQLRDSIDVYISAILAGTNGETLIIPAGSDPYLRIQVNIDVDNIESVTGLPSPIVTSQNQALPASNNTIISAKIAQTTTAPTDTNYLNMTIGNQMPFDLGMEIVFRNFYLNGEPLAIDTVVPSGQTVENPKRLDGYVFRNPDSTTVVDSILVDIVVTILPEEGDTVVTIPMDMGDAAIDIGVIFARLKFESLEGFFNESFSIPAMAITNIPTGFANVNFGSVLLKITFFNEIQARTDLSLELQGFREGFEPREITASGTIAKATSTNPVAESSIEIDIAPVFNMVPDTILISGEAAFPSDDTSRLQVGRAFWGTYEIVVPFQLKIEPMTFIPVKSNEMAAIDSSTRKIIQQGLIESSVITEIINDFPFSGSLALLISNYDYFPLEPDSLDPGYFWLDDTLYAITDTGNVPVIIDTLVYVVLPEPLAFDRYGGVKTPGFSHMENVLDSLKMEVLLRNETHYIRARIHFNGTDDFVKVGYNDEIQILSAISLTVDTGKILGGDQEEEQPAPVPKIALSKSNTVRSRDLFGVK